MRNEHQLINIETVFETRLNAIDALVDASKGIPNASQFEKLDLVSKSISDLAAQLGKGTSGEAFSVLGAILELSAFLLKWKAAVRNAEADADRFLRAARVRYKELSPRLQGPTWGSIATRLAELLGSEVPLANGWESIFNELASIQLPLPLIATPPPKTWLRPGAKAKSKEPEKEPETPPVGIVEFEIGGTPFKPGAVVQPDLSHEMGLTLKLSKWPAEFDRLIIEPMSIEPLDLYKLPTFVLLRSEVRENEPLVRTGRIVLKVPQTFESSPMEFSYSGRFEGKKAVEPLQLEGLKKLSIRCFDPDVNPVTGYREADYRLVEIQDELRRASGLGQRQMASFMALMKRIAQAAGQALQDGKFNGCTSEAEFQTALKSFLRDDPRIGSRLEEHAHAAGGITDLSLDQIRVELKFENKTHVSLETAKNFSEQTAQYIAGSDRRLGIICILDNSRKTSAPGSLGNDIGIIRVPPANDPAGISMILGIVIIRANLSKPSALSK